jgi:hypothetical protein
MTDTNRLARAGSISTDTLAPIVREAVIVAALLSFMGLGLLLPAVGQEFPGTGIAIADIVVAAGTVGIVGTLIWAGPAIRSAVVASLTGPPQVLEDAASIARNLVVFAAVLIAHWGLGPVLRPVLQVPWAYDMGFLLIAIVPLAVIAYRLYTSLDPIVAFVTDGLVNGDSEESSVSTES